MTISHLLTYDLTAKTLLDGTGTWQPPTLTFGEDLTLALTFQETSNGSTVSATPTITALQAAVGFVDEPPTGGQFALQIGTGTSTSANTTATLPLNVGPVSLQMAINALTAVTGAYGECVVSQTNGSWLIKFPSYAGQPALQIRNNTLYPVAFGTLNAWQVNGAWVQELRLVQAPLAYTGTSATILPPAPSVSEVQAGSTGGGSIVDEIQALVVPPEFLGSYYLKLGSARATGLSVSDGAAQIQAALQPLAPAGGVFTVTNPQQFTANIDFGGTMAGTPYSLLQVVVESAPPGYLTFTLDMGMGTMWAALRNSPNGSVTVPLQVTIKMVDDQGNDQTAIIYVPAVTIQKGVIFPELAEVPSIDWLNPPSPQDYVPFSSTTVITGQQYYPAVIGDGTSTVFAIAHGLATEAVYVFVRQNISAGRQLVDGTDFSVVIDNANEVAITALTGAPAANAWAAIVMSAQTVAAFAAGLTVTIGQVTGLAAELASIGTQLAAIIALLPTAPPSAAAPTGTGINVTLPALSLLYPGKVPASNSGAAASGKLPRPAALFPCINTAVAGIANGSFPLAAPNSSMAGTVVKNATGVPQEIAGGLGHNSFWCPPNGYVGTDGRQWFVVNQAGSTNSFFPADMEQVLFVLDVNSAMLVAGSTLTVNFNVTLQLLQANTTAQHVLVIEVGSLPKDTSPATVATNLQEVNWDIASPILAQQLVMSGTSMMHNFGASVSLDATGSVFTAQRLLYGLWTAGATAPTSANFAIRARLIQFDTADTPVYAKGTVSAVFSGTAAIA